MSVERIHGTITLSDGTAHAFSLQVVGGELAWTQWGAKQRQLAATAGVLDAVRDAVAVFFVPDAEVHRFDSAEDLAAFLTGKGPR